MVPRERDRFSHAGVKSGLLTQTAAVPDEVHLLDHDFTALGQTLFRYASAQRIVSVTPARAVRGDNSRE
ncbi:hypothetical protein, partial [Lentzea indica]|uniref:hypothetical protein n=1 Tax=Lentzea indica TaxID=2604800 RepID=UPI00406BC787